MSAGDEVITAKRLSFKYAGAKLPALEDVDLAVRHGEFVLLTGPSGCGKTTLCRCFNGLIPNFYHGELSGDLFVDGVGVGSQLTSELSRKVGYVF